MRTWSAALALLSLLLGAEAVLAQADASGAALFARHCGTCHADPQTNGPARIGPPLAGIVGRSAAADPDYKRYSAALRKSGKVWTEAALLAYLAAPAQAVPGTTMTLIGTTTPAQRSAIIDYLKTAPGR